MGIIIFNWIFYHRDGSSLLTTFYCYSWYSCKYLVGVLFLAEGFFIKKNDEVNKIGSREILMKTFHNYKQKLVDYWNISGFWERPELAYTQIILSEW